METHSSILAWKIPWIEEPGMLQSTGLQTVRHDRATKTHTPSFKNLCDRHWQKPRVYVVFVKKIYDCGLAIQNFT